MQKSRVQRPAFSLSLASSRISSRMPVRASFLLLFFSLSSRFVFSLSVDRIIRLLYQNADEWAASVSRLNPLWDENEWQYKSPKVRDLPYHGSVTAWGAINCVTCSVTYYIMPQDSFCQSYLFIKSEKFVQNPEFFTKKCSLNE